MKVMKKNITSIVGSALAGILFAQVASAYELKQHVTVYSDVVYAKDLLVDAGEYANEPLFLSPDPGKTGQISVNRVLDQAEDAGIYYINPQDIAAVSVTRPSKEITPEVITNHLRRHIRGEIGNEVDFDLVTSALPPLTHADDRADTPIRIANYRRRGSENFFQAEAIVASYKGPVKIPVRGQILKMKTIPVLTRDVARGTVVGSSDIVEERMPIDKIRTGTIEQADLIVGKAAVRRLTAQSAIRVQDIEDPQVVQPNDQVAIIYTIPGLILTAQGRALDGGALGATISVMNSDSKRIIKATISNPGEVVVDSRRPIISANNITQATR